MGETHKVTAPGGNALAVSRREGAGLPVLFLNSFAADHTMWNGVRDRLTRPTVAYDARGHGASDIVGDAVTVADLAADARAVMEAEGLERAVVCGLSLGGLTAMQLAAEAPGKVAGLALANTAVNFPPASMWEGRAEAARTGGYPDLIQPTLERWLTEGWRAAHPEETEEIRAMLETMPPEGYAAACNALAEGDTTEALAGWQGRTLIIAGRHDMSSPVARAEEMAALSPGAELVVLDAAHVSSIEAPGPFAEALERFAAACEVAHG